MLWIHTSKIAIITGDNKYITYEKYIELFLEYLYKNQQELLNKDSNIIDITTIIKEDNNLENLIKDINIEDKNKIKTIIDSNITNNKTLIEHTNITNTIINNSDIENKEKIKYELNSKLNCNYGTNTENHAIKLYELQTNNKVFDTNIKLYNLNLETYLICGKIDGKIIDKLNNEEYLIEIKNRKNKFYNNIPIYEQIQILTYTKLVNITNIIFIQCLNNKLQINTFYNYNNETLWNIIINKLKLYTNLIYLLSDNDNGRIHFLLLNNIEKYKFLYNYLNWLEI